MPTGDTSESAGSDKLSELRNWNSADFGFTKPGSGSENIPSSAGDHDSFGYDHSVNSETGGFAMSIEDGNIASMFEGLNLDVKRGGSGFSLAKQGVAGSLEDTDDLEDLTVDFSPHRSGTGPRGASSASPLPSKALGHAASTSSTLETTPTQSPAKPFSNPASEKTSSPASSADISNVTGVSIAPKGQQKVEVKEEIVLKDGEQAKGKKESQSRDETSSTPEARQKTATDDHEVSGAAAEAVSPSQSSQTGTHKESPDELAQVESPGASDATATPSSKSHTQTFDSQSASRSSLSPLARKLDQKAADKSSAENRSLHIASLDGSASPSAFPPISPALPASTSSSHLSPLASKGAAALDLQQSPPSRDLSFNSIIRHSSMHADSVIHHGLEKSDYGASLEDVDLGCDTDLESGGAEDSLAHGSSPETMPRFNMPIDDKTVLGVKQEREHVDKLVNDKFNLQVENMMLRKNLNRGDGSHAGGEDALRRAILENREMKEKIEQMEKELERKRGVGIDSEEIRELKDRVVSYEEQIEYLEGKQQQQQEWDEPRGFGRSSRLSGSRAPSRTQFMSNRTSSRQSYGSDFDTPAGGRGQRSRELETDEAHLMDQMHKLQNLIDPGGSPEGSENGDSFYSRFSVFLSIITQYIISQQEKFRHTEQEFHNLERDYEDIQIRCTRESEEENEDLRVELSAQIEENNHLRHELNRHKEEGQHYEREILALYPDIQTLENNNKRLKKDLERKIKLLSEAEEKTKEVDSELQRATEVNEEMVSLADSLEEELQKMRKAEGAAADGGKEAKRLEAELQKQVKLTDAARKETEEIKAQLQAAQSEKEMLQGASAAEHQQLKSESEKLSTSVTSLQSTIDKVTTFLSEHHFDVSSFTIHEVISQVVRDRDSLQVRVDEQEVILKSSESEVEQELARIMNELQVRDNFIYEIEGELDDALEKIQHMQNHEARVEELTKQLAQFEDQFATDQMHMEQQKKRLEAEMERVKVDADMRSTAHQKQLSSWQKKLFNVECNRGDFSRSIIEKLANILGQAWKDAHDDDLAQLLQHNSTPSADVVTKLSNDALQDLNRLVSKGNSEITKQLHQLRVEVDSLKFKNNKHEEQYRSLSNLYKKAGLERDDYKKRLALSEEESKRLGQQLDETPPRRKLGSTTSVSSLGSDEEDMGRVQVAARDVEASSSPMGKPFSSVLWGIRNEDIQQRLKLEKEMRASDKAAAEKKIKELEEELSEIYRKESARERTGYR